MDIKKIVDYWIHGSEEDYKTAQALFSGNRYTHALFFCHLTIEKILKGLVVKKSHTHSPLEHNLLQLAKLSGLEFSTEQLERLAEINTFNIRGRYDDYRFGFYKRATKSYTEEYFSKTKDLYTWLKKQITK